MKTAFRIGVALVVLPLLLAACGGVVDPTPKKLTVENHWGGNTGGKGGQPQDGGDAISNFLGYIAVLKSAQLQSFNDEIKANAPLVVTYSFWDETGWADGAYANGRRVSKGEFFYKPGSFWPGIVFNVTTHNGITATIAHPSDLSREQSEHEQQGLSLITYTPDFVTFPFRNNLPYVALSDGRRILADDVAYPSGVAFDSTGRLWVADNGPDQNYKIFNVPTSGTPRLVDTFGEPGGVFAAGTGKLKGQTGEKRFWGPRGVGFGDNGEIIVGTTGIPGLVQGGTDVRAFDKDRRFLWDVKGIFMHAPGIDPTSNGTQIYTAAQRFEMDYSQVPGKSWRQAAITLDPYRFPHDIRVTTANEIAFVRVVNGKKFLFVGDMNAAHVAVFRFEANSEIAIPAAIFGIRYSERGAAWTQGKEPVWEGDADFNKNRRQAWRDKNGDGLVDADEFFSVQMPYPNASGYDIDDNGNIWVAGKFNEHSNGFREGGNLIIPFGTIDANGVPFSNSSPRFVNIPSTLIDAADQGKTSSRLRYLAATDTLVMVTGKGEDYYSDRIYVIDGHQSANPRLRFKLDLGYDTKGSPYTDILDPRLDPKIRDAMVLPTVFTADADYLYVGYMQNGLDNPRRGEITVYSMKDGHKVGWILPGAETNYFAGNFDMRHGIQVTVQADGTRTIVAEENGAGKFMVYRWKP